MQTLLLVSHTHWDREWYLTFEQYRTRLVATFDHVLDVLERLPEFHSFAFDGQSVPVDDYLQIRPEALERLRTQVTAKRLVVGPLYVIPDGYAPSGEAWVRNFLLGLHRCKDLGGEPGHLYIAEPTALPEQLPQIIRRFGFNSVIFGRGLVIDQRDGSDPRVDQSEFYWEGPDGSRLLVVHMPAAYDDEQGAHCILHYCNAAEVFWSAAYDPLREQQRTISTSSPDDALERVRILREHLAPLATSEALLLMHGCDHLPPQADTPELIRCVNERLDGAQLVHGSFADYLRAVKRADNVRLVRRGESRRRGGAMSRVFLRRLLTDTLTILERWMEPSAALAWLDGCTGTSDDPANLSSPADRGLMRQAWRYLLQNLAHDTIWGCSVDEVYDEVRVRFAKSRQIAEEITGQALELLAERADTNLLAHRGESRACVAYNLSGWDQTEVMEAEFWLPPEVEPSHVSVRDETGRRWLTQVLTSHRTRRRTDRYRRTAAAYPVMAVRALVRAQAVPAMGYRTLSVEDADEPEKSDLRAGKSWIENEQVRVEVRADGSFDLTDRRTGRVWKGLNRLVDQADGGNGWAFGRVERDKLGSPDVRAGTVDLVERGPVRATIEIRVPWELPEGLSEDGNGRSECLIVCPLVVRVSLLAGKARVEVRTVIDNRARNHRLRAYFPTGVRAEVVQADGAFAVHERPVYLTDPTARTDPKRGIGFRPSMPEELGMMQSFLDVSDGVSGFALLTRGLPQYEVQRERDTSVVFVLTLMRAAIGHTRTHDPDLTVGDQCPGEQAAEYAIYPHAGDWFTGGVLGEATGYLAPPRVVHTTWHDGPEPQTGAWMKALPREIMLTTVKRSEDGNSVVMRLVNVLREERRAHIVFRKRPTAAARANLREEPENVLLVGSDGSVQVVFAPMEIVTLRLDWSR